MRCGHIRIYTPKMFISSVFIWCATTLGGGNNAPTLTVNINNGVFGDPPPGVLKYDVVTGHAAANVLACEVGTV
jgi:hypothetical protein